MQSALKEIRSFLYGDVCDVYVEYIKPNIRVRTLKVIEIIIFQGLGSGIFFQLKKKSGSGSDLKSK